MTYAKQGPTDAQFVSTTRVACLIATARARDLSMLDLRHPHRRRATEPTRRTRPCWPAAQEDPESSSAARVPSERAGAPDVDDAVISSRAVDCRRVARTIDKRCYRKSREARPPGAGRGIPTVSH